MSQASTPLIGQYYLLRQSSIVRCNVAQWTTLKVEGIVDVEDLAEFDDDDIDSVIQNLRRPQDVYHQEVPATIDRVEVPADLAKGMEHNPKYFLTAYVDAYTEKQPPLVCSMFTVKELKLTDELFCHYTGVGCILTQENMTYIILNDYNNHLKSVKGSKKDQNIKLMKFCKETVALGWFKATNIFWDAFIGARNCPVAYVLREEILPDRSSSPLLIDTCYSEVHNLIKEELTAFLSRTYTLYKGDKAQVFKFLEETLRGSSIDPIIQPYKQRKDGRKA